MTWYNCETTQKKLIELDNTVCAIKPLFNDHK